MFDILDYAQSRKVDVLLGEWSPARRLNVGGGTRVGPAEAPWPCGAVDYAAWAHGIRNLHAELIARGLGAVKIAGPDNSGDWEWLDHCARELPLEPGAWEIHWYAKDADVLEGRIEQLLTERLRMLRSTNPGSASKPVFLGESGMIEGKINGDQQPRVKEFAYGVLMADYVAQVARAAWQAAIAWDMDDAMHVNQGGHVEPPAGHTLKIWGFWNTQGAAMGHPEDEAIRPWFYTWSLMSRLFPRGATIVNASIGAGAPAVRTLAATRRENGRAQVSFESRGAVFLASGY